MITYASQQAQAWSGFNGLRGFGQAGEAVQATMLDGTLATPAQDSNGDVVGFTGPLLSNGTTNSYDANGNLIATTAAAPVDLSPVTSFVNSLWSLVGGAPVASTPGRAVPWSLNPTTWGAGTIALVGVGAYLVLFSGGGGGGSRRRR